MSANSNLIKAQISRIIQSGGSFGSWLGNLGKRNTNKFCHSFSQRKFIWISKLFGSKCKKQIWKKKKKKNPGKGAARAGKGFTLFISNEDMSNVIKIIKPLEDSNVLINSITETVKHKIKKLVQPVISFLVKVIIGRKVRRARRRYMDKNF